MIMQENNGTFSAVFAVDRIPDIEQWVTVTKELVHRYWFHYGWKLKRHSYEYEDVVSICILHFLQRGTYDKYSCAYQLSPKTYLLKPVRNLMIGLMRKCSKTIIINTEKTYGVGNSEYHSTMGDSFIDEILADVRVRDAVASLPNKPLMKKDGRLIGCVPFTLQNVALLVLEGKGAVCISRMFYDPKHKRNISPNRVQVRFRRIKKLIRAYYQ